MTKWNCYSPAFLLWNLKHAIDFFFFLQLGIHYKYPNDVIYSEKLSVNQLFINHLHLPKFWREIEEKEELKAHQNFM